MKPRNAHILLWLIVLSGLFGQACEKGPTKPAPVKDPRQYTWTIDTLSYNQSYQTMVAHIWGSSPKDVYAGGHCSTRDGILWHYNGTSWMPQQIPANAPILTINEIFGFAQNNLYAIGNYWVLIGWDSTGRPIDNSYSSSIHFDGSSWQTALRGKSDAMCAIGGTSPSNLWAGGVNGELYHYDGTLWKPDSIPVKLPESAAAYSIFNSFVGHADNAVYSLLTARDGFGGEWYYLLRHNGTAWAVEDSMKYTYFNQLWMSPSGTLYATGSGVKRRDGAGWTILTSGAIFGVGGKSDKDIFACGEWGVILHYNGQNWQQFDNLYFPEAHFYRVLVFDQEVFIAGYAYLRDRTVTLILHGK